MTKRRRRRADSARISSEGSFGVGLLVCVLVCSVPVSAQSIDLETVLARARVTPPARVSFVEERENPLFVAPLELTGYLEYAGPGDLRKVIETPFKDVFSIKEGEIELESDGEPRNLPAAAGRVLEAMLGAIEAILSGDASGLESVFVYEISGTENHWTIDLAPQSRRVRRHVRELRVTGDADSVSRIVIDLDDGERHTMRILRDAPTP
jgi:hypothetical protein